MKTTLSRVPADLRPALYLRIVSILEGPCDAEEVALEEESGSLILGNDQARSELECISSVLRTQRLAALAIKGTAHLIRFRQWPLPRALSDLDLIVNQPDAAAVLECLNRIGYVVEEWNSPEDTFLHLHEGPGIRLLRSGSLPVDLQIRLPGLGASPLAEEEAWVAACSPDGDEARHGVLLLHPMHELLLAVAHLAKHLEPPLRPSPKWITDMLMLVYARTHGDVPPLLPPIEGQSLEEKLNRLKYEDLFWPFAPVDARGESRPPDQPALWTWDDFWATARRWDIEASAGAIVVTLNAHWQAAISSVPEGSDAIPLERLAAADDAFDLAAASTVPRDYLRRAIQVRTLPGVRAKLRYIGGLVFPSASNLRRRYQLPENAFLPPHYARHLVNTARKFLRGLVAMLRLRIRRVRAFASPSPPRERWR